jgi:hypothetical protein
MKTRNTAFNSSDFIINPQMMLLSYIVRASERPAYRGVVVTTRGYWTTWLVYTIVPALLVPIIFLTQICVYKKKAPSRKLVREFDTCMYSNDRLQAISLIDRLAQNEVAKIKVSKSELLVIDKLHTVHIYVRNR